MTAAGWYQDPWSAAHTRYFDGERWTPHTRPGEPAPRRDAFPRWAVPLGVMLVVGSVGLRVAGMAAAELARTRPCRGPSVPAELAAQCRPAVWPFAVLVLLGVLMVAALVYWRWPSRAGRDARTAT